MSKDHKYSYNIQFRQDQLEYDIRMKKKRNWWWLLLFLLPLLLLIQCSHDVVVQTLTPYDDPIADAAVESRYTEYQLLKGGRLFYAQEHILTGNTDENGLIDFGKQPTSVWSWLFHAKTPLESYASKTCLVGEDKSMFHWRFKKRPYVVYMYNTCHDTTDIPIHVVDKETGDDIPQAFIKWSAGTTGDAVTDEHGIFYIPMADSLAKISRIEARADGYADTVYVDIPVIYSEDSMTTIYMRPMDVAFNCDIVMCIDNTYSMNGFINSVKNNILYFYRDLNSYCKKLNRRMGEVRIQIIEFGDFADSELKQSPIFTLPEQSMKLKQCVMNIGITDGGDAPEDGLETLAFAMDSPWMVGKTRARQVIIVYTDASAHPLGTNVSCYYYPNNMPGSFEELTSMWLKMNSKTKRLILFAPKQYPWTTIASEWDNVDHPTGDLHDVLQGKDYDRIIETICKSL